MLCLVFYLSRNLFTKRIPIAYSSIPTMITMDKRRLSYVLRNTYYSLIGKEDLLPKEQVHPQDARFLKEFLAATRKCQRYCAEEFPSFTQSASRYYEKVFRTIANSFFYFETTWSGVMFCLLHMAEWTLKHQPRNVSVELMYEVLENIVSVRLQLCIDNEGGWRKALKHLRSGKINGSLDLPNLIVRNLFSLYTECDSSPPTDYIEFVSVCGFLYPARIYTAYYGGSLLDACKEDLLLLPPSEEALQNFSPECVFGAIRALGDRVLGEKITFTRLLFFVMYVAEWSKKKFPTVIESIYLLVEDIVSDKLQIWVDSCLGWLSTCQVLTYMKLNWRTERIMVSTMSPSFVDELIDNNATIHVPNWLAQCGGWERVKINYPSSSVDGFRNENPDLSLLVDIFGIRGEEH